MGSETRRRIALVTDELLGFAGAGGLGTATSYLAIALGRFGHEVRVLYRSASPELGLDPEWAHTFRRAGVDVQVVSFGHGTVEPSYFARMLDTERALLADPPDVVVTQDLAAPVYTALRSRQLGLGFEDTLFVVYCHGTRRWITDAARKVRVLPGALAVTVLEQASIELTDVAVSPSAYMLDWMREQGWQLPTRSCVIPLLTRSAAFGESSPQAASQNGRIVRLAFFGRLEERKGVRPFVAGLNALEPELLRDVELVFLGRPASIATSEITPSLSQKVRGALRTVSFETGLGHEEALARLSSPGTVAVMPSLEDNSPSTVYECLERGIPFVASNVGGTSELVAPEDRERVLFEPTPQGVESVLRRVLSAGNGFQPASPALEIASGLERWNDVVEMRPAKRAHTNKRPVVDVIVTDAHAREARLHESSSDWVVFLGKDDVPRDDLLETLVTAQSASGADIVTCGIRVQDTDLFFVGEPDALGLLANGYGTVALIRRALLETLETPWPVAADPDWPLLALLSLKGAKIVSVPRVLVERRARPGDIESHSGDALVVAQVFEQHLPGRLRSLARLAGGFAATPVSPPRTTTRNRVRRWLSDKGRT